MHLFLLNHCVRLTEKCPEKLGRWLSSHAAVKELRLHTGGLYQDFEMLNERNNV